MIPGATSWTVRAPDRLELGPAGETFDAIDAARQARPGKNSRKTWLTEAVEEKPARERVVDDLGEAADRHA